MPAIPKGSLVLVTGANGFLASHVADGLLALGYKVRGTVRSQAKGKWLSDHFDKQYGEGTFTLAVVPDIFAPGALASALADVSGIAHVASDTTIASTDPNQIISPVIDGLENILAAATNARSVERVVYTSSAIAALEIQVNQKLIVNGDSWNREAVERAWAPPPYEASRLMDTYAATKIQAEEAFWKFIQEKKPKFTANSVLPGAIFGPSLHPEIQLRSSGTAIPDLYLTGRGMVEVMPPYAHHIDVRDVAQLHVAGIIDEDIVDERIFGMAHMFDKNELVEILRNARPDHDQEGSFPETSTSLYQIVGIARAEKILKKNFGHGFISLEESVKASIAHLD